MGRFLLLCIAALSPPHILAEWGLCIALVSTPIAALADVPAPATEPTAPSASAPPSTVPVPASPLPTAPPGPAPSSPVEPRSSAPPSSETAPLQSPVKGELGGPSRGWPFTVRAMLQFRYQHTSVSVVPGLRSLVMRDFPTPSVAADTLRIIEDTARNRDGLYLRRAFLDFEFNATDYLVGRTLLDFARVLYPNDPYEQGVEQLARVAAAELKAAPWLDVEAGITEIPFSAMEPYHDTGLEVAEEGPTHELLHHMRFLGSEVGLVLHASPTGDKDTLAIDAGAFDAGSIGAQNSAVPGLLAVRATARPASLVTLGAGFAWRPHSLDNWWEELRFRYQEYESGIVFSADATLSVGDFVLRGEWLTGDRTDNDVEIPLKQRRGEARRFMSVWGIAAFRLPIGGFVLTPALRAEYLDTDREHPDVGGILHLSGALNLDLSDRVRLLADATRHFVQFGTRNWLFDLVRYDVDYVSGTLQLQLKL